MNQFIFLIISFLCCGVISAQVSEQFFPVISSYEIADLELISSCNGESGVVGVLDRTVTKAGKEALKRLLTQPTADANIIKARQALIQYLRNPDVRASVESKLATIAQHEAKLRMCFEQGFQEQTAAALKENYFSSNIFKKYNSSSTALDVNNAGQFFLIFTPLLELSLFHGPFARWLGTSCGHDHSHDHKKVESCSTEHKHDNHHHDHDGCCDHDHHHDQPKEETSCCKETGFSWKNAFKNVLLLGHGALGVIATLKMAKDYFHRMSVVDSVHQAMISVNACMSASADIRNLLVASAINAAGIDAELLMAINTIEPELMGQCSNKCFNVTKKNHLSIFSRVGPTLSSYTMALNKQTTIEQLLSSVGSIDAMLSIAKLMDEPSSTYNFVTLREGSEPYIKLDNFIHPQLASAEAIKNSIILGDKAQTKLVITGPNKAGKSSVTKAIAVNCVLAQSFGVITAGSGVITPMHRIITYINIHDNMVGGISSFLGELKRTDVAEQELKALNGKAPSLCLFDDSLFRTTQPQEGEMLAYRFVKRLAALSSSIVFVVTHYELLSSLAAETSGCVMNCRIGLVKDVTGNVTSTFKLEPGVSPRDAIFSIVKQGSGQAELLA